MVASAREIVFTLKASADASIAAEMRKLGKAASNEQKNVLREQQQNQKAYERAILQSAADTVREGKKGFKEISRASKEATDEQIRDSRRIADARKRAMAEGVAEQVRQQREYEQLRGQVAKYQAGIESSNKEFKQGALDTMEGITKVGRGFAALGLVNEKTSEDILKGLIKVQGAFDIISGGIKIWAGLTEGMNAYRNSVVLTTAAEGALAAARARSAAAGIAGSAAGAGQGAATAAGGAGAAGPIGVAVVAAAAAAAVLYLGSRSGANIRGGRSNASTPGGEEPLEPGFLDRAGMTSPLAAPGTFQQYQNLEASIARRKRQQEQRGLSDSIRRSMIGGAEAAAGSERVDMQLQSARERADLMGTRGAAGAAAGQRQYLGSVNSALASAIQERGKLSGPPDEQKAELEARINRLLQERITATQQLGEANRKVLEEKKKQTEETTRTLEKEREVNKEKQAEISGLLKGARESFGSMSAMDQRRILMAREKQLQAEQLEKSGRGDEAAAIRKSISTRDLNALSGLNVGGTKDFAGRAFGDRAAAAGFDRLFGGQEQREIAGLKGKEQDIEVKLKDQRELKVKIERDDDKLKEDLVNEITRQMQIRDARLLQDVSTKLSQTVSDITRQSRERLIGERNAIR